MSLADSLESAAEALPEDAQQIRPANGDPFQLLEHLDSGAGGRVLAWLFNHEPEAAAELAEAWLEEKAGAALVLRMSVDGFPKAGRKALRRLVHQARSRGVAVEGAGERAPRVARLPDLNEKISMAHVSPYDPRGGRLVYLVESSPTGGARVFEALLDVQRGIVDFQVYRAGRRQVGAFVRDLKRRSRFAAVEADPASVRALIARRLASHPPDRPLPKTFSEWRAKLGLPEGKTCTPGEQVRQALGAEPEEGALEALAAEVAEQRLGPWPPQPAALETVVVSLCEEFGEADRDPEALGARVGEAVRSLYLEPGAASANAERFEETAYLFWRDHREDLAAACLATADGLRSERPESGRVVEALVAGVIDSLMKDLKRRLGWDDGSNAPALDEAENS
jgi:hypothetical protein